MAKLAVNALIGLWARSKDVFYSMRTSNHEVDGRGCHSRSSSTTGASATTTTSTPRSLLQPLHAARPRFRHGFGVRGDGEDPPGAARGAASLPGGDENRLPSLSEPSAKVRAHRGGADQAAPPGQHAQVSLRGGQAFGGRVPGAAARDGAADGAGALAPRGGSRGALPQRPQPLVVRHAGHGQDAPGEADRFAALAARRRGHPDLQDALQRPEPGTGCAGLSARGAARWAGWWSRRSRSSTSGCGPTSPSSPRTAGSGFCCSETFDSCRRCRGPGAADAEGVPAAARPGGLHELTENRRSDERIFRFLQYLRVDEAEQVPLRDAVQVAREQFPMRGLPDTCLVISHAHHRMAINDRQNRRLARRRRCCWSTGRRVPPGRTSRRPCASGRGSGSWGRAGRCPRGAS